MLRLHAALAIMLTVVLAGCETSDDKGGYPDADPAAVVCTGVDYDNCSNNSQCMSQMCHLFSGEFQICTKTCTPGDSSTCPPGTDKCNNRGICKPILNNACRPPS